MNLSAIPASSARRRVSRLAPIVRESLSFIAASSAAISASHG
jgi:hypothetical protein